LETCGNENHHTWQRIGFEQEADFDFDAKLDKISTDMSKIGKEQWTICHQGLATFFFHLFFYVH
jgi:hypothetical protein